MTVEELIFAASRGGWPASLLARTPKAQLLVAKNYVQTICSNDISSIDGKKRDARLTSMILRAYARNVSTLVKKKSLLDDVTSSGEASQYHRILPHWFHLVIECPMWNESYF
jgi:uncharacterized protein